MTSLPASSLVETVANKIKQMILSGSLVNILPGERELGHRLSVGRETIRKFSAHGCACDSVAACRAGGTTFFLTGGSETPATLCQQLAAAGLGGAAATVGENLGTPSQRLVTGRAQELAAQHFAPLSVLLVENVPAPLRRTPGLPDAAFIRGKTPMTKQEVRAAALAKLAE